MECPRLARIGRIEGEGDAGHRPQKNRVAHRSGNLPAVDGCDLEVMPMEVHGMGHHRMVAHFDNHPLAPARGEIGV